MTNKLFLEAPRECSFKLWQGECVAFSNCAYAVNKQLSEFLTPEAFQDITDRGKACEKHGKGSGLCCEKSGILPSKPTPAVVHVQVPESTTAIASTPRPPVVNLLAHPNYKLFKTLKCGVSDPSDRIAFGWFGEIFCEIPLLSCSHLQVKMQPWTSFPGPLDSDTTALAKQISIVREQ